MMQSETRWHVVDDARELARVACERVLVAAAEAIAARGRFDVVLAGGTTPQRCYERLATATAGWSAWHVWFGDERCLGADDADRNSVMARDAWLGAVAIPSNQIHVVRAGRDAHEAARDYAAELVAVDVFDLVLLGLGEDGHTASLFPGHDWGEAADAPAMLAVTDAPKPPSARVSMSAARLSRARQVLFLVDGEGKRDALARWRAGARIPAAAIRPDAGVDVLAVASLLTGT